MPSKQDLLETLEEIYWLAGECLGYLEEDEEADESEGEED
jgi:hypothetical protein